MSERNDPKPKPHLARDLGLGFFIGPLRGEHRVVGVLVRALRERRRAARLRLVELHLRRGGAEVWGDVGRFEEI